MKKNLVLILENIRSTYNVGSLIRTAECLGINKIYFTGYTPYPYSDNDLRLKHIAIKNDKDIQKTALNAQNYISWEYQKDIIQLLTQLKDQKYQLYALEQDPKSIDLNSLKNRSDNVALIVGNEVKGISSSVLKLVDKILEIKMKGRKESLNVVQASAIGLYHLINL